MKETGVVKFQCEHVLRTVPEFAGFAELNGYRRTLLELGFLGVDSAGIGFGNVSIRDAANPASFYITGSGTGRLACLTTIDYARVTAYDFEKNWLRCEGQTIASSESLTHAAVYESEPQVMSVIHAHNAKLWTTFRDQMPTTPPDVVYGTPAMAYAIQQLFLATNVRETKFFVMAGHHAGVVSIGKDLPEAFTVLTHVGGASA